MMVGTLATLAMLGTAIAAGLGVLSFWWTLIPAFFAASLALSNGPAYDTIIQANREGRMSVFPMALAIQFAMKLALAAVAYGVATLFA